MLHIIAFAGLEGSGASTATGYLAEKGMPKVAYETSVNEAIDQIKSLEAAGQRKIVLDSIHNWSDFVALKHTFPGQVTVVGIVSPRHIRHHRLTTRKDTPLSEQEAAQSDHNNIEQYNIGGIVAAADHYVIHLSSLDVFLSDIDKTINSIG